MPLIEWSDTYSVKNPSIDTQHKKLIGIINELHDAIGEGKGRDIVGKVISELVKYTKTHFSDEEKLMAEKKYPWLDEHKKFHQDLTGQVVNFEREFKDGKVALSHEVRKFLRGWILEHIMKEDTKYIPHLGA
ncbi:MAG: bacteriohemerythrin [Deltaproteobacteria bacterium]|nr:bacteriohemerythrin [Deltaproteobacteria bacterium]